MNKRISTIIPVYNAEKCLLRCINSFYCIDKNDIEIILSDDGSPDGSPNICDEFAFNHSTCITIHKHNDGVSVARNVGIEIASGDYLFFCDSDDEIISDGFSQVMLDLNGKSDMIVCGVEGYTYDYPRNEIHTSKCIQREEFQILKDSFPKCANQLWIKNNMLSSWSKFYKKTMIMIHNIRFNTSMVVLEDYDFVLSVLSHCNVVVSSKEIVYRYYREKSGVPYYAKRYRLDYTDDVIHAYNKHTRFLNDNNVDEANYHWYIWKDLFGNFGTALNALWAIPTTGISEKIVKCRKIRDVLRTPAYRDYVEFFKCNFKKSEYFIMKHPTLFGVYVLRKIRAHFGK